MSTNLKPCPACGCPAIQVTNYVECSANLCGMMGPGDDHSGSKWNALPRSDDRQPQDEAITELVEAAADRIKTDEDNEPYCSECLMPMSGSHRTGCLTGMVLNCSGKQLATLSHPSKAPGDEHRKERLMVAAQVASGLAVTVEARIERDVRWCLRFADALIAAVDEEVPKPKA